MNLTFFFKSGIYGNDQRQCEPDLKSYRPIKKLERFDFNHGGDRKNDDEPGIVS